MQAPGADVLGLLVDRPGDLRETPDAVGLEADLDILGGEQRLVLTREAGVGCSENSLEILDRQRIELDPDRKAPLELRYQVRRLGKVERAARDEEYVIRLHHSVLRGNGRPLHERQQVPLHTLARDV